MQGKPVNLDLEASEKQRRSFLADVTHELRTPLSVIRGQAEGIADGLYPADAAHLAPIVEATQTLARLVDDLRTLALAEAGHLQLQREPVLSHDLRQLLERQLQRQELIDHPDRTIYSVKRLMGRGVEDVREELKLFPFRIAEGSEQVIRVVLGERTFTPPEVSALILRQLKKNAEAALGGTVSRYACSGDLESKSNTGHNICFTCSTVRSGM